MHINAMQGPRGMLAGMSTPLTDSQRLQLQDLLERRKAELLAQLGAVQRDTLAALGEREGQEPSDDLKDQADRQAQATVRDAEATRDHDELVAVRAALARMADGSYGECTACSQSIGAERLFAQPAAARCIACQSQAEARAH